jgi:hypothetical protein
LCHDARSRAIDGQFQSFVSRLSLALRFGGVPCEGAFLLPKAYANYACSKSVGARDRADGGLAIGRVGKGRAELRIHYGPRYQLDLAQHGATLNIQLCGGDQVHAAK